MFSSVLLRISKAGNLAQFATGIIFNLNALGQWAGQVARMGKRRGANRVRERAQLEDLDVGERVLLG